VLFFLRCIIELVLAAYGFQLYPRLSEVAVRPQTPNEESKMELQTRIQILAIAMSFGFVAAVILGMV
jgi:hypothetical protein